jgi:glucose/arabinose dehydrogenase
MKRFPIQCPFARFSLLLVLMSTVMFSLNLMAEEPQLQFKRISTRGGIVDIANAGDGSGRLFLVEQLGRIFIMENGVDLDTPFLNITNKVMAQDEQGLLSLAFAPDFKTSGYFYIWYTANGGGTFLARFKVSEDPNVADPLSQEIILSVSQPFANHNGGRLQFGPDGMLYLGLGDGGGSGDLDDNAQNGNTLLGKLIRIDVDPMHGTYAIPVDNPFASSGSVRNEIWALGLRNPWRISFDRETGDLYIADVGQNRTEEVSFQPGNSTGGENYGWNTMEGSNCVVGGCNTAGLILPVSEYDHDDGCAISGGEVYRGKAYPNLIGMYLYGDFCSGKIWGLSRNGNQWSTQLLVDTSFLITTFGQGEDRSVYVAHRSDGIYLISDGEIVPENSQINVGHAGAWFYPPTSGQGQFIDIEPGNQTMFISWFTYTDAASANPLEQRWLTALGSYSGDTAVLDLHETLGGKFDDPLMVTTTRVGDVTVSFSGCELGLLTYNIPAENLHGSFPMQRVISGSDNVCQARNAIAVEAVNINAGMDGSWFDSNTPGQGFFIDVHTDQDDGSTIFVSWFTYGNTTASGQRWLTALGGFTGSGADLDVFETTGGSFDDPQDPSTTKVGTMSIDFSDCSNAILSYSLPADPAAGDVVITRVISGGQTFCEELDGAG